MQESQKNQFDLVFLDLEWLEDVEFNITEKLVKSKSYPLIIFCSNQEELVFDCFKYQPFWFLCKSRYKMVLKNIFVTACRKMCMRYRYYNFNNGGKIYSVKISDIRYFDVLNHRIYVHLNQMQTFSFREKIEWIEHEFREYGFVRINSGCVVNLRWIKYLTSREIILRDETTFPISRSRKNLVKEQFNIYVGKVI